MGTDCKPDPSRYAARVMPTRQRTVKPQKVHYFQKYDV